MPTNMTNMTIFMSRKYSCLRICNVDDAKVIVCTCSKLVFQPESNKHRTNGKSKTHRTKMGNQNKQSHEWFRDDEITKANEIKQKICKITYLIRIEGKTIRMSDF